ncbi:hypothetical protein HD806DRAFT_30091 [Xylariaceae sp. AK1471]|nr:hypothetical protein HD806DRAFT_30091 [Xylariaceae sp. AK1471]
MRDEGRGTRDEGGFTPINPAPLPPSRNSFLSCPYHPIPSYPLLPTLSALVLLESRSAVCSLHRRCLFWCSGSLPSTPFAIQSTSFNYSSYIRSDLTFFLFSTYRNICHNSLSLIQGLLSEQAGFVELRLCIWVQAPSSYLLSFRSLESRVCHSVKSNCWPCRCCISTDEKHPILATSSAQLCNSPVQRPAVAFAIKVQPNTTSLGETGNESHSLFY